MQDKIPHKLKFASIRFENNWKNDKIYKLIECYFIFITTKLDFRDSQTIKCRPIFGFALLNFGFVILFEPYIIKK